MKKFEYLTQQKDIVFPFMIGSEEEMEYLNTMGNNGWKLITTLKRNLSPDYITYYWEREIEEKRVPTVNTVLSDYPTKL